MSKNLWGSEEEFRDIPDQVNEQGDLPQTDTPVQKRPQAIHPTQNYEYQDIIEPLDIDDEEQDYARALSDARIRLEQGRLYEMIINHELFDGLDCDPTAIKHVQRQIRNFAKLQMEIMLGMRQETSKVERLEIDFPFNAIEVDVLRKLALAASKGASANSDNFVPEVRKTTENVPAARKEGLNSITKPIQKEQPKKVETKKLPQTAREPLKRQSKPQTVQEQIDALEYEKPLEKDPSLMTQAELQERNARIAERQRQNRATTPGRRALPMPTFEQQNAMYAARSATNDPKGTVNTIMSLLNQNKN